MEGCYHQGKGNDGRANGGAVGEGRGRDVYGNSRELLVCASDRT